MYKSEAKWHTLQSDLLREKEQTLIYFMEFFYEKFRPLGEVMLLRWMKEESINLCMF